MKELKHRRRSVSSCLGLRCLTRYILLSDICKERPDRNVLGLRCFLDEYVVSARGATWSIARRLITERIELGLNSKNGDDGNEAHAGKARIGGPDKKD